ncbi:hypothetical protein AAHC03_01198 [Spirometra sp. Aus1]
MEIFSPSLQLFSFAVRSLLCRHLHGHYGGTAGRKTERRIPSHYRSYHFQEVRRRLIRLIGRPAIRINDHAAMKELQMALEKEAEEEAEAHERRLAEVENKRIQALILTGVLDTSALKGQEFTEADRSDQPAGSSVTIKSRSEDESHLDFRRYTRNPTAAKYNVLHIAEKVDKMSSDPIEPRAKWKDVKPRVTCEGQTNNLLGETAYMLQEVLESDGGLKIEDIKKGIGKSGRRIKIPRMSFAESRLKAKEIGATGAVIVSQNSGSFYLLLLSAFSLPIK